MRYLLIFLFAPIFYFSQNFNVKIINLKGDLNKDGIEDIVIIKQDTLSKTHPYLLQIFFKNKLGKLNLVVSSMKAISPEFPNGIQTFHDNTDVSLEIKKGILWLKTGLIRGHFEHKFRFNNNNFELIGFSFVNANVNRVEIKDFNLLTGKYLYKEEEIGTDKILVNMTKKIFIRPLPKLQDFEPLSKEYY